MSAIGDYIHYTREGYEKHGISKNGSLVSYNYGSVKNLIKNRMSTKLQKYNLLGLEDSLNYLLGSEDNSEQFTNRDKILEKVYEILYERFGETLGKIDFDTGDVSLDKLTSIARAKGEANKNKIQTDVNQQGVYLSTIISRIRAIEKIRDSLSGKGGDKVETLNKKINEIYHLLKEAYNDKEKGLIGNFRDDNKLKNNNVNNKTIAIGEGTIGHNLITDINTILKDYSAAPAINLQKGDLFEYLIALAPLCARGISEDTINNEMEKFVKSVAGGERSKVFIRFDKFTDKINYDQLNLSHYAVSGDSNVAVSYGTSQGKIDINLAWNNQIVPVSAKNVNLASGNDVHILSGASFLALIQDMDPDFVNHYLNVVAQHHKYRLNDDESGDAPIDNRPVTGTTKAHEAMKWMLLYKALSGDAYGRDPASVFIVNDNSKTKGGVKVFTVEDLVKKGMKAVNTYATITSNDIDLSKMVIENHWNSGDYRNRITDFISRTHQQKISASLKVAMLNK